MKNSRQVGAWALLLSVVGLIFAAGPSHALTYNVTSLADDGGAGELRAAINSANGAAGTTITFQAGLTGKITLSPTYQALPIILVPTTIQGPGELLIAIDGRGTYRPFNIKAPGADVTISGLTIEDGMDAGGTGGGAILVQSGDSVLTGCTLSGNIATGAGGAIENYGEATLSGCTLTGNQAYNGGGIYNYSYNGSGGTATLTDCTLSNNSATINGGGIDDNTYSGTGGDTTLVRSTLSGNVAGGNGGGLYDYCYSGTGGIGILTNCVLSNNSGAYGGGIYDYTYSGSGGTGSLKDCSLSGNSATHTGGIYNYTYSGSGGKAATTDTILYGDVGGEIFGAVAATYCDLEGGLPGTGNINVNPLFINAGSGNLSLQFTSPCIQAGTSIPGVTTDLPGLIRHNPPTIGAYEEGSGMSGHNVVALQNASTNQVSLWAANGTVVTRMGTVSETPPAGLKMVDVADFNGDGMPDLLFQDRSTSALTIWYLNDLVVTGTAALPTPDPGWDVVGSGDFNGDGKPDIVFQNQTDFAVIVWCMNGAKIVHGGYISQQPSRGWKVAGVGDFTGNGRSDILFQNGDALVVWYMDALTVTSTGQFATSPSSGWNVVAVTSLYGHVNPDLVFQPTAGGQAEVWELSNTEIFGGGRLSVIPGAGWLIDGAR